MSIQSTSANERVDEASRARSQTILPHLPSTKLQYVLSNCSTNDYDPPCPHSRPSRSERSRQLLRKDLQIDNRQSTPPTDVPRCSHLLRHPRCADTRCKGNDLNVPSPLERHLGAAEESTRVVLGCVGVPGGEDENGTTERGDGRWRGVVEEGFEDLEMEEFVDGLSIPHDQFMTGETERMGRTCSLNARSSFSPSAPCSPDPPFAIADPPTLFRLGGGTTTLAWIAPVGSFV